jgi:membrane protein CcdC involved in cytochrome C biogenesis
MKKLPLLPHVCQKIGFILVLPFLALGILYLTMDYTITWLAIHPKSTHIMDSMNTNLTDELAAVGLIISLMLIAFSKEKIEDEAIQFFRLASLQWAVIVNYLVLVVCILAFYGGDFFSVMVYNMFTILFFFVIRFRFVLFQHTKTAA